MMLPTNPKARKAVPVFSGALAYFPRAIAAVAALSQAANDKHNPGEPLHWSRHKSADHRDALVRHLMDTVGNDAALSEEGHLHLVHVAWRALAAAELALEAASADRMRRDALARSLACDRVGGFMQPATNTGD